MFHGETSRSDIYRSGLVLLVKSTVESKVKFFHSLRSTKKGLKTQFKKKKKKKKDALHL